MNFINQLSQQGLQYSPVSVVTPSFVSFVDFDKFITHKKLIDFEIKNMILQQELLK